MKKVLAALLATAFTIAAIQPANAETTWIPISSAGAGEGIVAIKELDMNSVSSRFAMQPGATGSNDARICGEGPKEGFCDYSTGRIRFDANQVLPLCKSATDENCLVGLRTATSTSPLAAAELVREVNISTYEFEDLPKGLYKSGKPAIFKASNAAASGGSTDYVVVAK